MGAIGSAVLDDPNTKSPQSAPLGQVNSPAPIVRQGPVVMPPDQGQAPQPAWIQSPYTNGATQPAAPQAPAQTGSAPDYSQPVSMATTQGFIPEAMQNI